MHILCQGVEGGSEANEMQGNVSDWQEIIDWMTASTSWKSKFHKDIAYFAFAATVNGIWRERNQRLYQQIGMDEGSHGKEILQNIRDFASSWTGIRRNKVNWEITIDIGIHLKIFT